MNPKISIILPTYNVETYIRASLESCINQSLKEIEILIVDDCGSDKSIEIAMEYANKDCRIKILRNEVNQGTFQSRNNGAKAALAEYLLFLDPDDELDLSACETLYNARAEFDIVRAGIYRICERKKEVFINYTKQAFDSLESYANWLYRQKSISWNIWGSLIKKDKFLKAINMLNHKEQTSMAEDLLINFAIWNLSESFLHLDSMLYFYNLNPQSIGYKKDEETIKRNLRDFECVIAKIQSISENCNVKLTKLFLSTLINAKYAYLSNLPLDFKAKIKRWLINRYFVFRRKVRVAFGI